MHQNQIYMKITMLHVGKPVNFKLPSQIVRMSVAVKYGLGNANVERAPALTYF